MVGPPGFEPGTSCTPSKRASQAAPRPDSAGLSRLEIIGIACSSLVYTSADSALANLSTMFARCQNARRIKALPHKLVRNNAKADIPYQAREIALYLPSPERRRE